MLSVLTNLLIVIIKLHGDKTEGGLLRFRLTHKILNGR